MFGLHISMRDLSLLLGLLPILTGMFYFHETLAGINLPWTQRPSVWLAAVTVALWLAVLVDGIRESVGEWKLRLRDRRLPRTRPVGVGTTTNRNGHVHVVVSGTRLSGAPLAYDDAVRVAAGTLGADPDQFLSRVAAARAVDTRAVQQVTHQRQQLHDAFCDLGCTPGDLCTQAWSGGGWLTVACVPASLATAPMVHAEG